MKTFFRSRVAQAVHAALFAYLQATGVVLGVTTNRFQKTYDNELLLKDAGLIAASADATLIAEVGNAQIDADLIIDIIAIEIASDDEAYTIVLEGSPDATFGTAANIAVLGRWTFGADSATAVAPQGFASAAGRDPFSVSNQLGGTVYPFLRLRTVVAGTVATGINYRAYLAKR
jgi:hypothetical protein